MSPPADATRGRAARLVDVAQRAGVTPSIASRALRGIGRISPEKRAAILLAAQGLGYRPNHAARSLRRGDSSTLGLIVPDLESPTSQQFVHGAEEAAAERGYSLLVCNGRLTREVYARSLNRLFEQRVDGLLVAPYFVLRELLQPFEAAGIPIEPAGVTGDTVLPRVDWQRGPSLAAFRHLVALGHRRVAIFLRSRGDVDGSDPASLRARLLRQILAEPGVAGEAIERWVSSPEECPQAVHTLVASPRPPTAYVSGIHLLTPVLLRAIADEGLSIPGDVSFVTYGDSAWALAYKPSLSAITLDNEEEGRIMASRLIARIELEEPTTAQPAAEFILRESCGPAKA